MKEDPNDFKLNLDGVSEGSEPYSVSTRKTAVGAVVLFFVCTWFLVALCLFFVGETETDEMRMEGRGKCNERGTTAHGPERLYLPIGRFGLIQHIGVSFFCQEF